MENWFWFLGWSLSILTMGGNGFVIFIVCRKERLRTKTNAFIVSLAVADFFVGMSAVPSLFVCEMASECNPPGLNSDGMDYLRWLFAYASGANLCSLVLDRFVAVARPLRYLTFMKRRRVIQMVFISWAIPLTLSAFATLRWFNSKTPLTRITIEAWLCLVLEILFCAIVIFCFASMIRAVWKHKRSARILSKQLRFNHHVLRKSEGTPAVKMMAVVIGMFLILYGIALRCSFVHILNPGKPCNDLHYKVPILVLNSAVNPLTYAIFKRDIKKEFKNLIHKHNRT